jgi:branched-subunit amino acid ABC-type transport system permease component
VREVVETFLNLLVQGVLIGGLYALFALGLSLSLGVMRFVNIAHGDMIVLFSFVILSLTGGAADRVERPLRGGASASGVTSTVPRRR